MLISIFNDNLENYYMTSGLGPEGRSLQILLPRPFYEKRIIFDKPANNLDAIWIKKFDKWILEFIIKDPALTILMGWESL